MSEDASAGLAPYRTGAGSRLDMDVNKLRSIEYLASRSHEVDEEALQAIACEVSAVDVFEAVAAGKIGSFDASRILEMRRLACRARLPLLVRFVLAVFEFFGARRWS